MDAISDSVWDWAWEIISEVSDEVGTEENGEYLLLYEGWSPICFGDIYDPELSDEGNEDQFYRYAEEREGQVIEEWVAQRRGSHKLIDSGHESIGLYGVTWALFKRTWYFSSNVSLTQATRPSMTNGLF